ncbi:blue-light-activated protein [Geobacter sp. OR-1]|uniref:response regulator n=1 Tax=Geobacter sp. OR-1 TaxID=1266765 RepID=UPI0005443CCF|nr:response regulator [Geobacter sp. OR-1]GAM10261.1 blue-light-activated protein [Geobacter sp. OR-1]
MNDRNHEHVKAEILIVEDSPTQAEELKYTLERHNYSVLIAGNGREALALLREHKPAMVISDIVMPEMDGYQLCREIKQDERLRNLPVILLTSLSNPRDVVKGLECGADNFLTKPYEEKYILSRIQYIIANKNLKDIEQTQLGVEIILDNERYFIKSDRIQILNLLLSSYEAAIQKNGELIKIQKELKSLNEQLELRVKARTDNLLEEIGERIKKEEELRKSERRISIMDRISTVFLTVADEEVFGEVLKVVLEVMVSRFGIFGFIADNGDLVIPSMTREVWDACQIPDKTVVFPPDSWGETLWGRAIREKTSFYSNEPFQTPAGHIAIDNFLTVPIVFGDKAIGLLSVANKTGGYCDEDKELQEIIASRISPILNARQQRDRQEQERRSAEEALRFSNNYNRSLIEASIDPLVTIAPDGKITDVNTATEKITGYSRDELIGDDFSEHFTEPEKAREGYQLVFSKGEVRDYPLQIHHRDGHDTSVLYNASVFRDEYGELKGVFAAARDITEHKVLESQLMHAQKMEAIGQLAGGVAHDFNNVLTGIIGFSTLIEMGMAKNDPQRENLNHVLAAADRAADLTRSLLTFSRKQTINPKPVDLNQIISKTEKFLKRIIGEDIELKSSIAQDAMIVNADSGQIEQVLINLATNARDAMPKGGLLSIETDTLEMDAEFVKVHGYGEPGEFAVISISDTGEGMDETTRKKVFEPFFTTKEVGKGTGLGLSIVFGIVKQHNGFINLYSEPGKGTTFRIYLPLIHSAVTEKQAVKEETLERGTETILVADDETSLRELAEKVLGMFGYSVITASDGVKALAKFKENRERIDLVILDIVMPKMNGQDAFDEMKKLKPDLKAIFISGYTSDIIQNHGMLDPDLVFVSKPLNPKTLLLKVRKVLGGSNGNKKPR